MWELKFLEENEKLFPRAPKKKRHESVKKSGGATLLGRNSDDNIVTC